MVPYHEYVKILVLLYPVFYTMKCMRHFPDDFFYRASDIKETFVISFCHEEAVSVVVNVQDETLFFHPK